MHYRRRRGRAHTPRQIDTGFYNAIQTSIKREEEEEKGKISAAAAKVLNISPKFPPSSIATTSISVLHSLRLLLLPRAESPTIAADGRPGESC